MVYEEGCGNAIYDDEDMEDGAESSESELDVDLEGGWDGGLLSKEDIMFFRKRLQDVVLPTGIPGMPSNLGDAKAGSLKASQWHSLFAFIIPLIIVELYVADDVEELKNDTNRVIDDVVNSENGTKKDPSKSRYRIKLDAREYELLLDFSQVQDNQIQDYRNLPHPPRARVLQPYAIPRATWRVSKRIVVSVLKPNNCIEYKDEGKTKYGIIRQIYEYQNVKEKWETVLLVSPINNLYPKDLESPSRIFRYLIFLLKCVVGQIDKHHIILPTKSVVCVAAYRLLPTDVFGIKDNGIMLRPYDYNSQLDIV
ncbi:uncharacterized protein MELLADRAFT_103067 [Melampsora larici-populina 98AG31]|uniref:Uncharacterized protein n=1 Tax=Melampsora larici-populina (strain 98AG31 / pathotype 3-4-7) TaxID=747676 RepID=F4RAF6_MELLP|nr:uncharacterized protein MELLADRAFT_103067 [Melampsora larici-populina 98AG31]EGG10472.1 hypothetical protein MELLADRAFT_103067 [Melampsora larici-populina 98AG31]